MIPQQVKTKCDHALGLAQQGFYIFPLIPNGKRPALKAGWKEIATRDADQIRSWWDNQPNRNIGIDCGQFVDDGLTLQVLDVDIKNGKKGDTSLIALDFLHGPLPETLTVQTTSGGQHLYLTGPGVGNRVEKLADGLDVRSVGGYVVGPGSEIDGNQYTVIDAHPVAVCPEAIHKKMADAGGRMKQRGEALPPAIEPDLTGSIQRAIAYLKQEAPEATQGAATSPLSG